MECRAWLREKIVFCADLRGFLYAVLTNLRDAAAKIGGIMRWIFALILLGLPVLAHAQDLPAALAGKIERKPDKYLAYLVVIITGYGKDGAIDMAGLQSIVAMERAEARATGFWRLQDADLDGDGAIAGDEMQVKAAASDARARGRLILYFGTADANADGRVSADELQSYANAVALESYSEDQAAQLYAIMAFDKNRDGRVTLPEAKAGIDLTLSRAAQKNAGQESAGQESVGKESVGKAKGI
jgi:hypothetical protein